LRPNLQYNRGGDLLDRVQRVRQNVAGEVGILLPKVRIRDNMRLEPQQYRIKIADIPVAEGHGINRKDLGARRLSPRASSPGSKASEEVGGLEKYLFVHAAGSTFLRMV
jgi:flagellar biosynthesis component FlhA